MNRYDTDIVIWEMELVLLHAQFAVLYVQVHDTAYLHVKYFEILYIKCLKGHQKMIENVCTICTLSNSGKRLWSYTVL